MADGWNGALAGDRPPVFAPRLGLGAVARCGGGDESSLALDQVAFTTGVVATVRALGVEVCALELAAPPLIEAARTLEELRTFYRGSVSLVAVVPGPAALAGELGPIEAADAVIDAIRSYAAAGADGFILWDGGCDEAGWDELGSETIAAVKLCTLLAKGVAVKLAADAPADAWRQLAAAGALPIAAEGGDAGAPFVLALDPAALQQEPEGPLELAAGVRALTTAEPLGRDIDVGALRDVAAA